ncbi:MAG: 30S ribosomal protein S17 [Myxococcota bacterium]|nr:30S ribosomal protein S17 [Myxococcota bacterium]
MGEPTPKKEKTRGARRRLVGRVVSDTKNEGRAKKTIVVEVTRRFRDPVYGKYVKQRKKFHAHDEKEEYRTNDLVEIRACRPRSATKRWEAIRLIERPVEV